MVVVLPRVPSRWTIPVFVVYGFFFMSSYPMTEATVMESVPDAVRGRVFGLFITVGGLIGNLSHWTVGVKVKGLGTAAYLQLALAAAPVTWGCELFGPLLLAGDIVRQPVRYADGAILALDGPGLGVEVDEAALKAWTRPR